MRLLGFGTSSLDIEICAYIFDSDWRQFLKSQQDLLIDIIDIAQTVGPRLAYPSHTLYMSRSKRFGKAKTDALLRTAEADQNAHLQDVP